MIDIGLLEDRLSMLRLATAMDLDTAADAAARLAEDTLVLAARLAASADVHARRALAEYDSTFAYLNDNEVQVMIQFNNGRGKAPPTLLAAGVELASMRSAPIRSTVTRIAIAAGAILQKQQDRTAAGRPDARSGLG